MRDYDELVNALRGFDVCQSCPCETPEMCNENDCMVWQAADAIEELVAAVPKWISVEERLPGKDDMVFIYYEWTGQSGTVYKEVSLSTLGEIQHFGFKPIAWMPLPDPPKEVLPNGDV